MKRKHLIFLGIFLIALDNCDNYDYIILKNCKTDNKTNIISDDADFATIDGFTLYTANSNALNAV
jgi:hypothetical protein